MDIFSFITLIGGLALFLYGMSVMSQGLEKLAGGQLEAILGKMTSNPVKSLFLGIGITAIIQSSSAVTVMLVGLVNSGIMQLGNTVGVIMGSNIGTTVTAWILSLIGIQGDNVFVKLLNPESFSPVLAFIGILMIMISKKEKKQDVGTIMVGFAVLMYGMTFMSDAVKPLADSPDFTSIITKFNNPLLGVLTGVILTAVIQSSSASVGILQALSLTGEITYGMAIPIIMGQNIGTCVTALISSIGVNKNAKRVAVIHISFNLIGTAIFMTLYCLGLYVLDMTFIETAINPVDIAIVHSIFNIFTSVVLLPFSQKLVKIAEKVIKTDNVKEEVLLDERLLKAPTIALQECNNLAIEMAHLAKESMKLAMENLYEFDAKKAERVAKIEEEADMYEDRLGAYLIKLSACDITERDRAQVSKLLHSIGDFERITDHAVNIVEVAREIKEKHCEFSDVGAMELDKATAALEEIMDIAINAYENEDVEEAYKVEPLEEVVDGLMETIKMHHVSRLQSGDCTIQHGFIMSDLFNDYERVSDHCSNIALGIIELSKTAFEAHDYVNKLIAMDDPRFRKYYKYYREKYDIG